LCTDELLPVITYVIDLSLVLGKMTDEYKLAILLPHLKKSSLQLILNNYRPVSNLEFVSKLVEQAVASQLAGNMHGDYL
jgi:hypothetical protein